MDREVATEGAAKDRGEKKSRFRRICVYCGSQPGKKASYREAAIELGMELVIETIWYSWRDKWCFFLLVLSFNGSLVFGILMLQGRLGSFFPLHFYWIHFTRSTVSGMYARMGGLSSMDSGASFLFLLTPDSDRVFFVHLLTDFLVLLLKKKF